MALMNISKEEESFHFDFDFDALWLFLFQSWLVFDELSKPFFTEGDSVGFSNTKPPKDKDNNAYCQASERRKTPMRYKKEIEIHCVLCYTNKRKESLEN